MKKINLVSKLKNKVRQVEGKNIGLLYHFTSLPAFKSVLSNNSLRRGFSIFQNTLLNINKSVVSFTRNKNLNKVVGNTVRGLDLRLTIDGDSLSDKYKIFPIVNKYSNSVESEEIVESDIIGIDKYIKRIDIFNVDNFETYLLEDHEFASKVNLLRNKGVIINYE